MDTKYFPNGYVGFKLNSLQDVVKAQALGLAVCNENNYYYEEYVLGEDENGEETERQPTQEEIFERIQSSMQAGEKLYATFDLDCGKVVPNKGTTLQSDFFVNQEVFFMKNNKICKGHIREINLSHIYSAANGVPSKIVASYKVCTSCAWKVEDFKLESDNIFASKELLVKHLMEEQV